MSFRLKNVRATYQRALQQCLHDEIRDDLVEAYVDDLDRTLKALNKYKWKLTPKSASLGFPPA